MGQKMLQYYDFVGKKGGIPAKMRLAMMTGLPSSKAGTIPDSPDLIAKFRKAVKEITGQDLAL